MLRRRLSLFVTSLALFAAAAPAFSAEVPTDLIPADEVARQLGQPTAADVQAMAVASDEQDGTLGSPDIDARVARGRRVSRGRGRGGIGFIFPFPIPIPFPGGGYRREVTCYARDAYGNTYGASDDYAYNAQQRALYECESSSAGCYSAGCNY